MKKRPFYLGFLGFVFMGIAISFPIQIMAIYGHDLLDLQQILFKISPLNLISMICLIINSVLLLKASQLLKYTIPINLAFVIWNNLIVGSYGHDYSMTATSSASIAFALLCLPLITHEQILRVINDSSIHWWKSATRVKKACTTALQPQKGYNILAETYDISETGVYVPFSSCVEKETHEHLTDPEIKVGEVITLHIRLSQFNTICCEAQVVRVAKKNSAKPAGMGLRFLKMDEVTRSQIKKYISLVA